MTRLSQAHTLTHIHTYTVVDIVGKTLTLPLFDSMLIISADLYPDRKLTACCRVFWPLNVALIASSVQGPQGKQGMAGLAGADGPPVSNAFPHHLVKCQLSGWHTDLVLAFVLQGHPGKEGPPGEKGMVVSINETSREQRGSEDPAGVQRTKCAPWAGDRYKSTH